MTFPQDGIYLFDAAQTIPTPINYLIKNHPLILLIAYNHYSDLLFPWSKEGKINILSLIAGNFTALAISNINEVDKISNKTALMIAAENGNEEIVKLLLSHPHIEVDKMEEDNDSKTALILACKKGHIIIVDLLLSHGADCKKGIYDIMLEVLRSESLNRVDIMKLLISYGEKVNNINIADLLYHKGLHKIYKGIHVETIRFLIQAGANIQASLSHGETALIFVISEYNNHDSDVRLLIVRLLIEAGANIHDKDKYGRTALMVAALYGRSNIVALLIEVGANIHDKSKYGGTALMYAAKHGRLDIVSLLIEAGANS